MMTVMYLKEATLAASGPSIDTWGKSIRGGTTILRLISLGLDPAYETEHEMVMRGTSTDMSSLAYVHLVRENTESNAIGGKSSIADILKNGIDGCALEFTIFERTSPARDFHVAVVKLTPDKVRCEACIAK